MKSIDKLRDLADDINAKEIVEHMQLYPNCVFDCRWLDSWHSEFNRLIESLEAEIAANYLELPKDADGVPIHVGNICEMDGERFEVWQLTTDGNYWWAVDRLGKFYNTEFCHHVKPRTLEDVLNDRINDVLRVMTSGIPIALETALNDSFGEECADEIRELLGGDAE